MRNILKNAVIVHCFVRGRVHHLFDALYRKAEEPADIGYAKQTVTPITVGKIKETKVHFMLCVSFLMVIQVVEQGQCINENSMVQIAVTGVHPLSTSSVFSWVRFWKSVRLPSAIYAIIMMGMTISLAGKTQNKCH